MNPHFTFHSLVKFCKDYHLSYSHLYERARCTSAHFSRGIRGKNSISKKFCLLVQVAFQEVADKMIEEKEQQLHEMKLLKDKVLQEIKQIEMKIYEESLKKDCK